MGAIICLASFRVDSGRRMPAPTRKRKIEFQKTVQERIGRRGTELARIERAVLGMFRHNWAHTAARLWRKAFVFWGKNGAGDGIRTHDFNLGKVALYP